MPGIGWRYTVPAERGRQLIVVVEDRGPRHLVLADPDLDNALTTVRLSGAWAAVVAALLTGVRIRFGEAQSENERAHESVDDATVLVETVLVTSGSPLVGVPQDFLAARLGPDASLLAVIDERIPQLVETDHQRPIAAGDQLVLAGRGTQLRQFRATL